MGYGEVTAPPYDTLTDDEKDILLKNPYNILHLTRSGSTGECRKNLEKWIHEGILKGVEKDSLIILRQRYTYEGSFYERVGVIGTVNVDDPLNKMIEHEGTIPEFVEERKSHIMNLGAQTEPVFTVISSSSLHSILQKIMIKKGCSSSYEEPKGLWNDICILSEKDEIQKIKDEIEGKTPIIADGHHRYNAMKKISAETGGSISRMLVYITSLESEATRIGEVHRIFPIWDGFEGDLRKYYEMRKFSGDGKIPAPAFVCKSNVVELRKKEEFKNRDDLYIIESFLKENLGGEKIQIEYTSSMEKVMERVEGDPGIGAIIMPVWKKEKFRGLLESGKLLPPKSTYFYPKIPSGIAFYRMEDSACHCSSGGRAADS